MHPAKAPATYEDVLRAPEHVVAELIGGELFLEPRPTLSQREAASVLAMLLGPPFRLGRGGPGGWVLQDEPELHLGPEVLVPDLAGWRREAHPDLDLSLAFASVAPDWVCEVLSPSTQGKDRVRKLPLYGEHGVQHAWLIDPIAQTLEVYKRREGAWFVLSSHEGAATVRAEPFDVVAFELADLWAR
ncbi:Uma2 family endonuclease [Myxococcota bacterium]|nr:Uma2 family endonuclease [Myxococcota bacterium]